MAPGLRFGGLMTYPPLGKPEIADRWLGEAKAMIEDAGIDVPVVTAGNSPDMWHTGDATITERRPGTYIYYDRSQVALGAVQFFGLRPHRSGHRRVPPHRHPHRHRRRLEVAEQRPSGLTGHGVVMGNEQVVVKALSEEHGVIELDSPSDIPRVGDRLRIIPNHACVVSNLFDNVHLISNGEVIETVAVAARGRVD